jgi:hypothetical protein
MAMGIEPGPWVWFRALPDIVQALVIGLGLAVPLGIAAVMILVGRAGPGPGLRGRPGYQVASERLSQVLHPFASVPRDVVGRR